MPHGPATAPSPVVARTWGEIEARKLQRLQQDVQPYPGAGTDQYRGQYSFGNNMRPDQRAGAAAPPVVQQGYGRNVRAFDTAFL